MRSIKAVIPFVLIILTGCQGSHQVQDESAGITGCNDVVTEPKALNRNEFRIDYPAAFRRDGIQGTVAIQFLIGEKGEVIDRRVIASPHPDLGRSVMNDLRGLKFSAGLCGEKPVVMKTIQRIHFSL